MVVFLIWICFANSIPKETFVYIFFSCFEVRSGWRILWKKNFRMLTLWLWLELYFFVKFSFIWWNFHEFCIDFFTVLEKFGVLMVFSWFFIIFSDFWWIFVKIFIKITVFENSLKRNQKWILSIDISYFIFVFCDRNLLFCKILINFMKFWWILYCFFHYLGGILIFLDFCWFLQIFTDFWYVFVMSWWKIHWFCLCFSMYWGVHDFWLNFVVFD